MSEKDYLEDISEIKNIMDRSTRFISLSGLSGILAGTYALIGAYFANEILENIRGTENYMKRLVVAIDSIESLLTIALIVIFLALTTGIFLTYRKAKRNNEKFWGSSSKRLLLHFFIPLLAGGIFILTLIQHDYYNLIAPTTLIFYGLACVNASKFTHGDIFYLGISNIIIGVIATQFVGYGLHFWALGFGVFHIIYGVLMYFKMERN